ncbi:hypothetical protein [Dickeya dadantii]|uniref:hypothetical protein n=1 Tax=Dickeya dadantii TaxID=204038 RepID=UPI001C0B43EB|nr:hypothetical protein [Dickeya dadantii]QWT40603.1 hypothetical protein KNV89_20195 [Dickeya dadantii]
MEKKPEKRDFFARIMPWQWKSQPPCYPLPLCSSVDTSEKTGSFQRRKTPFPFPRLLPEPLENPPMPAVRTAYVQGVKPQKFRVSLRLYFGETGQ